jgi:hypothetical protein
MHGGVNLELRNSRKTNELVIAETRLMCGGIASAISYSFKKFSFF